MSTSFQPVCTKLNDGLTHVAFLMWAIAAVYFYQERLYSDSAFYLGKVIHYEQFWVELSRYVLVFSQVVPLFLIKLGCSMKTVLIGYSLGHVLFFYGMYWVGRYRWGSPGLGWFLIGTQLIGITQGFAAPMFELYYVAAFLGWWAVLLYKKDPSFKHLVALTILAGWVSLNYMLAMWLLGGMLVVHRMRKGWSASWRPYWVTLIGMVVAFVLKQAFTHHSYEEAKMEQFIWHLTNKDYTWASYWKPLWGIYTQHYRLLLGLIAGTFLGYLLQRRYVTALGYLMGLLMTQYIVALTYPHIAHSRYQEQCYFIAVLAVLLPLCLDLLPTWTKSTQRNWGLLFFGMTAIGVGHIAQEMDFFTQRIAYMQRLIKAGRAQNAHKLIIEEERMPPYMHSPSFTFSVESMLFSALEPGQRIVHLIRDTEWTYAGNAQTLQDSTWYLSTFRSFYDRVDSFYQHDQVNSRYFNFPPESYQLARGRHPSPDSLSLLKSQLHLTAVLDSNYVAGTAPLVPVTLHNYSPRWLGARVLHWSYHWWTTNDELVQWDHEWTALEVDVPSQGQYEQPITIQMPAEPGTYWLQLDLIGEGDLGWLYHPHRQQVQVK